MKSMLSIAGSFPCLSIYHDPSGLKGLFYWHYTLKCMGTQNMTPEYNAALSISLLYITSYKTAIYK
jgi:hypothetical protein